MNRKRTFQKFIRSYFEGPDIKSCEGNDDPVSARGETCDPNQNDGHVEPDEGTPARRSPKNVGVREAPPFPHDLLHDPERWREDYGRLPGHVMPDTFFRNGSHDTSQNAGVP